MSLKSWPEGRQRLRHWDTWQGKWMDGDADSFPSGVLRADWYWNSPHTRRKANQWCDQWGTCQVSGDWKQLRNDNLGCWDPVEQERFTATLRVSRETQENNCKRNQIWNRQRVRQLRREAKKRVKSLALRAVDTTLSFLSNAFTEGCFAPPPWSIKHCHRWASSQFVHPKLKRWQGACGSAFTSGETHPGELAETQPWKMLLFSWARMPQRICLLKVPLGQGLSLPQNY